MKKVIFLLSNPFKPEPKVYKEAKSLANNGYNVTVLAWDRECKYPKKEIIDGIKVERIKLKAKYGMSVDLFLKIPLFWTLAFFKTFIKNSDVIHTHDFDTAIIGFLFKMLGKKWVYDVHDLYFVYFSKGKISKIVKKVDLFFAKICDALIVPTESIGDSHEGLKEFYVVHEISKKKITTIWNVPDIDEFLNCEKINLKRSEKFTIGFIGAQRTVQNFIVLFEAVKKLGSENYKILFVGEGKDTEKLKKIIKEKYSDLDIEFIDSVDYRKIPNYYKLCDAIYCVYPMTENIKRAMPIKTLESSVMGIPLLVLDGSLNSDFSRRYNCGFIVKRLDIHSIMVGLKNIKTMKFDNKKIIEDWNWKIEEKKLLRLYEEVLE